MESTVNAPNSVLESETSEVLSRKFVRKQYHKSRGKIQIPFEIGLVYKCKTSCRLFLSISENTLITSKKGFFQEKTPYTHRNYLWIKHISVEELCQRWRIDFDQLDSISKKYFTPVVEINKSQGRGRARRWGEGSRLKDPGYRNQTDFVSQSMRTIRGF